MPYWSGHRRLPDGRLVDPYQLIISEWLPRWAMCGGWRSLFSLPIPGRRKRIVSFFVPIFSNWQGVPKNECPNYPWSRR